MISDTPFNFNDYIISNKDINASEIHFQSGRSLNKSMEKQEIICGINFYSTYNDLSDITIVWGPLHNDMSFSFTNSEIIPKSRLVDVLPKIAEIVERENISTIIVNWGVAHVLSQLLAEKYFSKDINIVRIMFTRAYTEQVIFKPEEGVLQYPKWLAELSLVNLFSGVKWINNDMLKALYHIMSARDYPWDLPKVNIEIVNAMILISAYCNYRKENLERKVEFLDAQT